MNKELLFSCFLIMIFLFSCNEGDKANETRKASATIEAFNWLVGDWERTNEKPDKATYESWQKLDETKYIGIGFTLQNKDTIWKENVRLVREKNTWNFEVTGGDDLVPTVFRLTSIEKGKFVCENSENEFPKKIEYKKEGDKIKAMISGGDMEIPFEFERKKGN